MALLGHTRRSASVTAFEPVEALVIETTYFDPFLMQNLEGGRDPHGVVERLRAVQERIDGTHDASGGGLEPLPGRESWNDQEQTERQHGRPDPERHGTHPGTRAEIAVRPSRGSRRLRSVPAPAAARPVGPWTRAARPGS